MRTVTFSFSRGFLLYRMVRPHSGFAHFAIGILSCVALRNRITSLYVFDYLQGNALYLDFARLQLAALLGIALVLCKQPGTPIFALHKAFKRRALICEHGNHLPVISLLSSFNEDKITVIAIIGPIIFAINTLMNDNITKEQAIDLCKINLYSK